MRRARDGLFADVASFEALYAAVLRAVAGKRRTPVPAAFRGRTGGDRAATSRSR